MCERLASPRSSSETSSSLHGDVQLATALANPSAFHCLEPRCMRRPIGWSPRCRGRATDRKPPSPRRQSAARGPWHRSSPGRWRRSSRRRPHTSGRSPDAGPLREVPDRRQTLQRRRPLCSSRGGGGVAVNFGETQNTPPYMLPSSLNLPGTIIIGCCTSIIVHRAVAVAPHMDWSSRYVCHHMARQVLQGNID